MQKVNIVCVGKIKEEFYRNAVSEYLKRLSRFAKVEIKEIAEDSLEAEAKDILRAVRGYKIALCIEGKAVKRGTGERGQGALRQRRGNNFRNRLFYRAFGSRKRRG